MKDYARLWLNLPVELEAYNIAKKGLKIIGNYLNKWKQHTEWNSLYSYIEGFIQLEEYHKHQVLIVY